MEWKQITVGPLQQNAYIAWNDQQEALIFDPGSEGERLIKELETLAVKPLAILLTHAHFDHIGAVDDVRNAFNIPVYIHEKEQDWLTDASKNGSARFPLGSITTKEAEHLIREEGTLTIGNFSLEVYETPGHSPGSVSFYWSPAQVVFSGDALFKGSIGRTDFPYGSHEQLISNIHKKLLTLPEETTVSSGHGPETTIGTEMMSNPFLSGF